MKNTILAIMLLIGAIRAVHGQEYRFPVDGGYINVKDFGVKGDSVTDDTDSLRAVFRAAVGTTSRYSAFPMIYFPAGVYTVSGSLEARVADTLGFSGGWRAGFFMVGQGKHLTKIRLKDNTALFGDTTRPIPMIKTSSETSDTGKYTGTGNEAFRHTIQHVTIDVGRGNPGAIGIDYLASNRGAVDDVIIRSSDPTRKGFIGLSMRRAWPGPALIKDVLIYGFDYGISMEHYEYGMTFEHIELQSQNKLGIRLSNNAMHIRDLKSTNSVPVINTVNAGAHITMIDALFSGGSAVESAIINSGTLLVRNLKSSGYGTIVNDKTSGGRSITGGASQKSVIEYCSHAVESLFVSPARTLNLPVRETPEFHTNDFTQWANVKTFGASPDNSANDDADGIQLAINSGKSVVYLPRGHYAIGKPIIVKGPVRKIIGLHSAISAKTGFTGEALIQFKGSIRDTTILSYLRVNGGIEHCSTGTLVIAHTDMGTLSGGGGYSNTVNGTGDVFFEDVIGSPVRFMYPQRAWARQLNPEFGSQPLVQNNGGTIWILGLKTEGKNTVINNIGGTVELLGGLFYPLSSGAPAETTCVINDNGRISLSFVCSNYGGIAYPTLVKERRGTVWRTFLRTDAPTRGYGSNVGLYVGYKDTVTSTAVMVENTLHKGTLLLFNKRFILAGEARYPLTASIFDLSGKLTREFTINSKKHALQFKSRLPDGCTVLRITDMNGMLFSDRFLTIK